MSDAAFHVPQDRHYHGNDHLWAQPDGATVRVGIDAIGLESLGELAYVTVKDVGTDVVQGESLGSLEAAKMTTSIAAPVAGRIVARNEEVLRNPLLVNEDPYGAGWLVAIEPTDWDADAAKLVSGDAIPAWAADAAAELEREG